MRYLCRLFIAFYLCLPVGQSIANELSKEEKAQQLREFLLKLNEGKGREALDQSSSSKGKKPQTESLLPKHDPSTKLEYTSQEALLSNDIEQKLKLTVKPNEWEQGSLYLLCLNTRDWEVQLAVTDVIFPDRVDDRAMWEKVTYKVSGLGHVESSDWGMNMAEYHNLFYMGDDKEFILRLLEGDALNVGVQSHTYQFDLKEAKQHIQDMKEKCL